MTHRRHILHALEILAWLCAFAVIGYTSVVHGAGYPVNSGAVVRIASVLPGEGGRYDTAWSSGVLVHVLADNVGIVLTTHPAIKGGVRFTVQWSDGTKSVGTIAPERTEALALLEVRVPRGILAAAISHQPVPMGAKVCTTGYDHRGRFVQFCSIIDRLGEAPDVQEAAGTGVDGIHGAPIWSAAAEVCGVAWGSHQRRMVFVSCSPLRDLISAWRARRLATQPPHANIVSEAPRTETPASNAPTHPGANVDQKGNNSTEGPEKPETPLPTPAGALVEIPPRAEPPTPNQPPPTSRPPDPAANPAREPGGGGFLDHLFSWGPTAIGLGVTALTGGAGGVGWWLGRVALRRVAAAAQQTVQEDPLREGRRTDAPDATVGRMDAGPQDAAGGRDAAPPIDQSLRAELEETKSRLVEAQRLEPHERTKWRSRLEVCTEARDKLARELTEARDLLDVKNGEVVRLRNEYVRVKDNSEANAWAQAAKRIVDKQPGLASGISQLERVKDLILSGELPESET